MKRCPKCEFLYEDEQKLCDMDGHALIHDLEPASGQPPQRRSRLRSIVLPACAGLLLAGILSATYYAVTTWVRPSNAAAVKTQPAVKQFDINSRVQPPPQSKIVSVGSASAMQSTGPAMPAPTNVDSEPEETPVTKTARAHVTWPDRRLIIPHGVPPLPRLKPLPTLPDAQPLKNQNSKTTRSVSSNQLKSAPTEKVANPKKDSRLTSVLRKTGRILAKPFKL